MENNEPNTKLCIFEMLYVREHTLNAHTLSSWLLDQFKNYFVAMNLNGI